MQAPPSYRVGERVRILAGDLIGETAVVRARADGPWELWILVLDSDGTVVHQAPERLERVAE